jgi:hypothetical protein
MTKVQARKKMKNTKVKSKKEEDDDFHFWTMIWMLLSLSWL